MPGEPIILFDGVCNFCNSAVNFVIKRDKNSVFKFATLQSRAAHQLLATHRVQQSDLRSFLFIENNKIYTRSTAALKVCTYLNGLWPLMYGFIIVPKFIRNGIYNWISKNRYHWFGKNEECIIPAAGIRARFLNEIV